MSGVSNDNLNSAFAKPDLWIGLVLGTVVGRTVDLISDRWWVYLVLASLLLFPNILIKDRVTNWAHRRRDRFLAIVPDMHSRRAWLVRSLWYLLDFAIGILVLAPASGFLIWFGTHLQLNGK